MHADKCICIHIIEADVVGETPQKLYVVNLL